MQAHPESELHRRGKMFGVLVVERADLAVAKKNSVGDGADNTDEKGGFEYIAAFSAMLDGTYYHEGFVAPIYEVDMQTLVGTDAEDSRRKQQWLFEQYRFLNTKGEEKNLTEIFRDVPVILSVEQYFGGVSKKERMGGAATEDVPKIPSGAGECCAPKLLQAAWQTGRKPVCMAEFWMGASPKDELRIEGCYYPACSGKCRPILRHMLSGMEVEEEPQLAAGRERAEQTKILYEDEVMVVAEKPAGLLSVPGKDGEYSLWQYLTERQNDGGGKGSSEQVYSVHRLDMDTSGVIVFAKSEEIAVELQRYFQRRDIEKVYVTELDPRYESALDGREEEGRIELPLLANPLDRPRQMVNRSHGKVAITRYQLTHRRGPHGGRLVILYPATGRTHQLRVHCAHPEGLGCPIYGDRLYGQEGERLMLHAWKLAIWHPERQQRLLIETGEPW